ncbi:hypothetical protein A9R01_08170 ['Osedax' symbiont bacterium Rs2_46_30_T18]|nr:hypothetical protein A9R01_08170 ['Osedax' symbiont bacterium Rs2_46_30_T18]
MSTKERLIQAVLFELIALIIFIPLAIFVTGKGAASMTALSVILSLIAMAWNYIFNLQFDKIFGHNRLSRSFKMRLLHGLCFEIGMVTISFPVLMWVLGFDFWTVLAMDFGAVIFFLIYAIAFNWVYDVLRGKMANAESVI